MNKKNTWSAINRPHEIFNDLIELAGQWNTSVDLKINVSHQITDGPISVKVFESDGKKKDKILIT
jgi:hypothetical protein